MGIRACQRTHVRVCMGVSSGSAGTHMAVCGIRKYASVCIAAAWGMERTTAADERSHSGQSSLKSRFPAAGRPLDSVTQTLHLCKSEFHSVSKTIRSLRGGSRIMACSNPTQARIPGNYTRVKWIRAAQLRPVILMNHWIIIVC